MLKRRGVVPNDKVIPNPRNSPCSLPFQISTMSTSVQSQSNGITERNEHSSLFLPTSTHVSAGSTNIVAPHIGWISDGLVTAATLAIGAASWTWTKLCILVATISNDAEGTVKDLLTRDHGTRGRKQSTRTDKEGETTGSWSQAGGEAATLRGVH